MRASYHNHSTFSDGKGTVAQIVDAAASMGIAEIGFSDHFVIHDSMREPEWAMPRARLAEYLDELRRAARPGGPAIRRGLEVDFFPDQIELIRSTLAGLPLDYVIGSVHYVGEITIDGQAERWARLTQDEQNEVHAEYWRLMKQLAQSGLYDIVAHMDLSKKFGYYPSVDLTPLIHEALDAIAGTRLVVELNTSGWHKPCADAYPTPDILRECFRRRIPVTLSADAHEPQHLLRDFDRGIERLSGAGYTQIARFQGREVHFEPLSESI